MTEQAKTKKRVFNTLSKKLIAIFIVMTILVSFSSCIIGYLKYSSTIMQLYNETSYSVANIVQSEITPEMGDFLENLIVYEKDDAGNFILNKYGHKIPKLYDNNGTKAAMVNLDMYADPTTLSGEALANYNKYYEFLDTLDRIRKNSGAKYILVMILCDGDRENDPYYEKDAAPYENAYLVYFADARVENETLPQIALSDDEIIALAASYGETLTKEDLRDENGEIKEYIYNNYCRLGIGMQSRADVANYPKALNIYNTNEVGDDYIITDTEYGKTAEAILPFSNSKGENVGVLSVDIEMTIIRSTLISYVLTAILATVFLVLLFMVCFLILMEKRVVKPIKEITTATSEFVGGDMKLNDNLKSIKTGDEIEALASSFNKMSADIIDYMDNLAAVTAEKERIGAELNVATQIQASMLPCIFPAFPDRDEFDIYATMNPAKEVGGDFYDFFMVDDTHLAIVMADVSGKGVPAALFMVIAKTLIKDHTTPGRDLGDVFTKVNELLCDSNSGELFVTAFEGVLDLVTGEFTYVNAGHEMPFICKNDGKFTPYKIKAAFVLAGMEGMMYKAGSITLDPGDKIFQYTDGVTEATNKDNQLYGMERLEKILTDNCDKTPTELLPIVKADIDKFVGEAPQFDDISMLCLEYIKKCGK